MSEKPSPADAPRGIEGLKNRLSEHESKMTQARNRAHLANEAVAELLGPVNKPVTDYILAAQNEARTNETTLWAISLVQAGVDPDLIQDAWDIRDQQSRDLP